MNTVHQVVKEYKDYINIEIFNLNDRLNKIDRSLNVIANNIFKEDSCIKFHTPNELISFINKNKDELYNKDDIIKFFTIDKIKRFIDGLRLTNSNEHRIYGSNCESYKKLLLEKVDIMVKIELYENYLFSDYLIAHIFREYFKNVGYDLLRPGRNVNELDYGVNIRLLSKDRGKNYRKHGNTKRKVNWGESLRTLKLIAKDEKPVTYERYMNKVIDRNEFIEEMKDVTYHPINNPNGKKYLVYVKDINFWLSLYYHKAFNKDIAELIKDYTIVPTNFVENETKSQIDFTNNAKNIEEIITTNLLGFRDKIRCIERFNMNYCLNNWTNDIQTS